MGKIKQWWLLVLWVLAACSSADEVNDLQKGQEFEVLQQASHPLENEQDLDVLLNEVGNAQYVLLGEASHGTAEYYTWRAAITRRLIEEKGFTLVAVEGDWPAMYRLNQYIRGAAGAGANARAVMQEFDRWPTWMWANEEVAELAEWLRTYNQTQPQGQQAGFYGLDVYSLWDSMEEVISYLDRVDPSKAQAARAALQCFAPYNRDEQAYASATLDEKKSCADELARMMEAVQATAGDDEAAFNASQNALVAVNAERYYHAMVRSNAGSWNIRDQHMMETINRLVERYGPDAKIIVWEHNTHVGDARATDMAQAGMVNVGQLVRRQHESEGVYVVGFGTYEGSVVAARSWGADRQVMNVPPAQAGSWEALLHQIAPADKIILLEELRGEPEYMKPKGHRAIGVVYHPEQEQGNYVPSVLPDRYDAFIFIDRTKALTPVQTGSGG
jgi:erythromycin esterase